MLRAATRRLNALNGQRFCSTEELRRTCLHQMHIDMGASMTGFGGWDMPLQYKDGIAKEHLHCRAEAGLFDVSHMVGVSISGPKRVEFIERVTPADCQNLKEGRGALTSILNERGGIIDDCIITNAGESINMVINAGHEDKDLPHLRKYQEDEFGSDVAITVHTNNSILALQGPKAAAVLGRFLDDEVDLSKFAFMSGRTLSVAGHECFATRSGYTGEDGFEITITNDESAQDIAARLLAEDEVKPIGLGARDSLRLEAGLCLYGNDIDDDTTPVEATLLWTIPKRRRAEANFVGAEHVMRQIRDKTLVERKRVGLVAKGPPARSHNLIFDDDGNQVGEVTSGVFGPSVKGPVAMGYVDKKLSKVGTALKVEIRGKMRPITVSKMPFVSQNYFRG